MAEVRIGVLGATSMVGQVLLPLLVESRYEVIAFSRSPRPSKEKIAFRQLSRSLPEDQKEQIDYWISLLPIWTLHEHFPMLSGCRARRIVALSSTSIFSKKNSSDLNEQKTAMKLQRGEDELRDWAEERGVEWVVLRPTLIYGLGLDRNLVEIAHFIARFGFFPLLGRGTGLRQPVCVQDVASACMSALLSLGVRNRAYALSGEEVLSYRELVARVFNAIGRRERFVRIPSILFRLAISCLRIMPRYRHWNVAMAERMDRDLVFDHQEAAQDFGYRPRPFRLGADDFPEARRSGVRSRI